MSLSPAAVQKGDLKPIYLMYGTEPGPVRQIVEALRKRVLDPGMEAFNHERFFGRDLEVIAPVLEACAQLPTMSAQRLVELADPEHVGKGRATKGPAAKEVIDALVAYAKDPNPKTVLVITSAGLDGRSRLVTAVKKAGAVAKFEPMRRDADAVGFVVDQARDRGLRIGRDAAQAMVTLVGTAQSPLLTALDRAAAHAGTGAEIDLPDVEAVVSDTRAAVIFELTDAVGMGQRDEALAVLHRMFRDRSGSEIGQTAMVMSMLIRQIRLIFSAKFAPRGNLEALGIPPFVARKLAGQTRRFDETRLRRALCGLAQLDRDLKGASFAAAKAPLLALQRWILDTCAALPGTAPRGA